VPLKARVLCRVSAAHARQLMGNKEQVSHLATLGRPEHATSAATSAVVLALRGEFVRRGHVAGDSGLHAFVLVVAGLVMFDHSRTPCAVSGHSARTNGRSPRFPQGPSGKFSPTGKKQFIRKGGGLRFA
jgi:hypothetical protein